MAEFVCCSRHMVKFIVKNLKFVSEGFTICTALTYAYYECCYASAVMREVSGVGRKQQRS